MIASRAWLSVVSIAAAVLAASVPVRANGPRHAVLVLFVDDSSQPWIRDMSDGIASVAFRSGADAPILYYEYLDTVRFDDAVYQSRLHESMKQKYADRSIDLVVAIGTGAIAFAGEARDDLWPGRPLLFASYVAPIPRRALEHPASYALSFGWGFDQTLGVMKKVFPGTRRVAVVAGSSQVEKSRQARNLQELRRSGFDVLQLPDETAAQTLAAVAALPGQTLVFIAGGQVGGDGSVVPTWPLCQVVSSAANRPTFMVGSPFLGCGVVGGLMRDFTKIGTRIGERAMDALSGAAADTEQVPFEAISTLAFDARQLARWQVDERRLPAGSTVQFRPFSLWHEYKAAIVGLTAALVVQFALIVGLVYERRHRIKAESDSRHHLALAAHVDRREAMTALTGSIAHELAQPLGSIRVNADAAERLIAANRATPDELREILQDIRRDDVRATEIVHRHRTMLKQREVERLPLDIGAVIRESVALVSHEAQRRRVTIDASVPPTICTVAGDQVLLQQVVVNLLMNAMDAIADLPAPQRRVTVGNVLTAGGVQVSVRDSGPGLPSQMNGRVFEPFVTTKANGLGIGLSIVRSIVEAHGGSIEAHNVANGGAVFRFTLPTTA